MSNSPVPQWHSSVWLEIRKHETLIQRLISQLKLHEYTQEDIVNDIFLAFNKKVEEKKIIVESDDREFIFKSVNKEGEIRPILRLSSYLRAWISNYLTALLKAKKKEIAKQKESCIEKRETDGEDNGFDNRDVFPQPYLAETILNQIKPLDRELLILRIIHKLSYEEIAKDARFSSYTVDALRQRMSRALERLRKLYPK